VLFIEFINHEKNSEMKIEKTTTRKRKIEISLPMYRKHGCHSYFVFSEERSIQICNLGDYSSIGFVGSSLAFSDGTKNATKGHYEREFNQALKLLTR
jgi:hypothetical protein